MPAIPEPARQTQEEPWSLLDQQCSYMGQLQSQWMTMTQKLRRRTTEKDTYHAQALSTRAHTQTHTTQPWNKLTLPKLIRLQTCQIQQKAFFVGTYKLIFFFFYRNTNDLYNPNHLEVGVKWFGYQYLVSRAPWGNSKQDGIILTGEQHGQHRHGPETMVKKQESFQEKPCGSSSL